MRPRNPAPNPLSPPARPQRIVLKIGSNVIASRHLGLNETRVAEIASAVLRLRTAGHEVLLVSSGAVLSGAEALGLHRTPSDLALKQAAAAVGQSRLMWAYEKHFAPLEITIAQILLTRDDINHRTRFLNARNTLQTLLQHHVLPIINENDTVSVDEMKWGDNDQLAALTAHLVDAGLLILLSDVDGLYTADPRKVPSATPIPRVEAVTEEIENLAGGTGDRGGTGGMASKVKAAKNAAACGVTTLILNGTVSNAIGRVMEGEALGTLFLPKPTKLASRKQWIAQLRTRGEIVLDSGAVEAISKKGKSLLPSGVRGVTGTFQTGDAVRCIGPEGAEVACGLTNYGAAELAQILGLHSTDIASILGYRSSDEVIHRDNMVVK
jgi:glutamate 5-kinase